MGLYERWTTETEAVPKIAVHAFSAALREMARGAVTRQQVIDGFELEGDEVTELDAIIAKHQSFGTEAARADYRTKLHDVMLLCEDGFYPKSKAKTELGF